jgi:hypothetical protein
VGKTYVFGARHQVVRHVSRVFVLPSIKRDGRFGPDCPRVPESLIRVIVYGSGVIAVLAFLVVFGDFSQITILGDVVRTDEHTGFCQGARVDPKSR